MSTDFDYQFELLKFELDTLQQGIRTYDSILFIIKGWAITIFSAVILFSAQVEKPIYLLLCVMSTLLFWLLDSVFKAIQKAYTMRYNEIEKFLQSDKFRKSLTKRSLDGFVFPDIASGFARGIKFEMRQIARSAFIYPTAMLYVSILILTSIIAVVMIKF